MTEDAGHKIKNDSSNHGAIEETDANPDHLIVDGLKTCSPHH